MQTPQNIQQHEPKYNPNAWQDYTIQELGNWVHLLCKRATMRSDSAKREKDITDAQNYLSMIQEHINSLLKGDQP